MNRKKFVITLTAGLMTVPRTARAQTRKPARVGWVGAWYSPSAAAALFDAFRQGLRELGYIEGQTLSIDARWMERITPEESARLTAELIRSKVDVLVARRWG